MEKVDLVVLWIKENFPKAVVGFGQGFFISTSKYITISEGNIQAEVDFDRQYFHRSDETNDWFFERPIDLEHERGLLIRAHITDPLYFEKLRQVLTKAGLTPK